MAWMMPFEQRTSDGAVEPRTTLSSQFLRNLRSAVSLPP
jgi:hypothetical protein